jgi:hypothetical protein
MQLCGLRHHLDVKMVLFASEYPRGILWPMNVDVDVRDGRAFKGATEERARSSTDQIAG